MTDAPFPVVPLSHRRAPRSEGWLLDHLAWPLQDDLLQRMALALEALADTIVDRVDQLEHLLDADTAPDAMLRALGGASGLAVGPHLSGDAVREALGRMASLRSQRGSSHHVATAVALATGVAVTVQDPGAVVSEGDAPAGVVVVEITESDDGIVRQVLAAVDRELPVGVPFVVVAGGRARTGDDEADAVHPEHCPTCGEPVPAGPLTAHAEHFCSVCDEPLFWLAATATAARPDVRVPSAYRCPVCGHRGNLDVLREQSAEFCSTCDHPLFWSI